MNYSITLKSFVMVSKNDIKILLNFGILQIPNGRFKDLMR